MTAGTDNFEAEAIFFLDNGHVIKEMLYVEFEAILDNVVGIPEFKDQFHQAAYVSIGNDLRVQTVVLFTVGFDQNGHVPGSWNLPLRYMASQAHIGPDLGEGRTKVLSADDDVEPEYRQDLWSCGKGLVEVLTSIRKAVQRNKLYLYADSGPSSFVNTLQSQQVMHATHFAGQPVNMGNQNYLVTNLESALREQHDRDRAHLEAAHADNIQKMAVEKTQLLEQGDALSRQVSIVETQSRKQIDGIVDKYKAKLRSQLAEQEARWQEVLAEKELSLHYAQEKTLQLRDELQRLENERPADNAKAVQSFLQQLMAQGVELIVSESRLGSHGLKLSQIYEYLENKDGFWAAQNGIPESQYKAWRTHYARPVCQAGSSTGCECGAMVTRVDHPRNFVLGESEMCREHRFKPVGEYY